jgi:hypothetical protein
LSIGAPKESIITRKEVPIGPEFSRSICYIISYKMDRSLLVSGLELESGLSELVYMKMAHICAAYGPDINCDWRETSCRALFEIRAEAIRWWPRRAAEVVKQHNAATSVTFQLVPDGWGENQIRISNLKRDFLSN